MKALYARLDESDRSDNAALTDAFCEWLEERLTQDDVVAELRAMLPSTSEADLLRVVGAIVWQVRQP